MLAALVILGLGVVALRFHTSGHLPHPFQSPPAESFMDFYNTAYWANRSGAYGVWHSVYPPLSFVFLRLWTTPACYLGSPYFARACDLRAITSIFCFYIVNVGLVFFSLRKANPRNAAWRTIALCAGLSMLYGLELGNLIIPCFTAFVLAEGRLIRSPALRRVFLATAINFKPYLLIIALPQLVRRRWGWLFGLGVAGLLIYAITYLFEGSGSPIDMAKDLLVYTHGEPNIFAQNNHLAAISSKGLGLWDVVFPGLFRLSEIGVIGCYVGAFFQPRAINLGRLSILTLTLISGEGMLHTQGYSGDYTEIFFLFLIFMGRWRGRAGLTILTSAYLLCCALDFDVASAAHRVATSFLGGRTVVAEFTVSISQFVRPALLLTIQYGLILLFAKDFRRQIKAGRRRLLRLETPHA